MPKVKAMHAKRALSIPRNMPLNEKGDPYKKSYFMIN